MELYLREDGMNNKKRSKEIVPHNWLSMQHKQIQTRFHPILPPS